MYFECRCVMPPTNQFQNHIFAHMASVTMLSVRHCLAYWEMLMHSCLPAVWNYEVCDWEDGVQGSLGEILNRFHCDVVVQIKINANCILFKGSLSLHLRCSLNVCEPHILFATRVRAYSTLYASITLDRSTSHPFEWTTEKIENLLKQKTYPIHIAWRFLCNTTILIYCT